MVLALAAAGGGYLFIGKPPEDVSNPDVQFEEGEQQPSPPRRRRQRQFVWPTYGYTADRTRYLDADLKPPFRRVWTLGGSKLLEFQPVLARGTLFFVKNNGEAYAVSARSGKVRWRRRVGTLAASSPAWSEGRLFITTLSQRIISLDARTGRVRWAKDLPSRSESSPVVIRDRVYFGSEDGTVYALRADDGRELWRHRAAGAVKGALAYSEGTLFFGDYAGQVTALRARDGGKVWNTGTEGRSFNRAGRFYSTAAVAFGRVYLGNTDGKVYSFAKDSGELAWSRSTGGFVYAGPAVARVPGTKPTVYIGSYDGRFYALDARSGDVRWAHEAGGRISGAGTVVGEVVYFSNLGAKSTTGLDVRTGRPVFKIGLGAFNPVISDGRRIYLTGYSSLYALEEREEG